MASNTNSKHEVKINPNKFISEIINIAIDPELGSPYMIQQAKEKQIKRGDINSWNDLRTHFDPVSPDIFKEKPTMFNTTKWALKRAQTKPGYELMMGETGGTTGAPKKTTFSVNMLKNIDDILAQDEYDIHTGTFNAIHKEFVLLADKFGVKTNLNWLAMLPTGPHPVGKWATTYWEPYFANLVWHIDLDPRFIKKAMVADPKIGGMYLKHLQDQAQNLIKQEFPLINGIFTTSIIIEKMFPIVKKMREEGNLQAIVHGGAPMSEETHRILIEDLKIPVIGVYGQSLFGVLWQSPILDGTHIDYFPYSRMNCYVTGDVSNPAENIVEYGEIGTVVSQRVSPECVIPHMIQDGDLGTRIKPKGSFEKDGVRDPHRELKQGQQMGVY